MQISHALGINVTRIILQVASYPALLVVPQSVTSLTNGSCARTIVCVTRVCLLQQQQGNGDDDSMTATT